MTELLCTIWVCLLIAFLIGLLLGWLIKRCCCSKKLKTQQEEWDKQRKADQQRIQSLSAEVESLKKGQGSSHAQAEANSATSQAKSSSDDSSSKTDNDNSEASSSTSAKTEKAAVATAAASGSSDSEAAEEAPTGLFTSKPSQVDDLKEIKGIGPVLEKTLNGLGIYQFKQLAELSEENVQWVASNINSFSSRIYSDNWIEQAKEKAK